MRRWLLAMVLVGACDGEPLAPACEEQPAVRDPIVEPGTLAGVDRTPAPGCAGAWIAGVEGRVEDPSGAGVAGARTQICVVPVGGELLCLAPPTTDASGAFAVPVTDELARCAERMTMRVLLPGATSATTYCELELTPSDAVISLADPIVLFPVERPSCLPAVGDAMEPRTVVLADGLELVDLRPAQLRDYDELAAARHDVGGDCISARAPAGGFAGAYGFRPEMDVEGGVAVRIPNATGLDAGASVGLYVLGGLATRLSDGTHVDEGAWARIGSATVGEDGAMIESDAGVLVTVLTWLAYRVE